MGLSYKHANEIADQAAAELRGLIREFINLCAIGDVDESTEAYGWGDLIRRAKEAVKDKP